MTTRWIWSLVVLCACAQGLEPDRSEDEEAPVEQGTLRVRDWQGDVYSVPVSNERGRAIYDGDVDLGPFERTRLRAYTPTSLGNRWANNTIRYWFSSKPAGCASANDPTCGCDAITAANCSALSSTEQTTIRNAFDEYERLTGISFVESNTQPYVALTSWDDPQTSKNFTDANNVNGGFVVMVAFSENLSAETDGGYRTVIHELGHSLGLAHEQKRPDAAGILELHPICMTNTPPFTSPTGSFKNLSPFDMDSMMMYTSFSFGRGDKQNCPTNSSLNCCPTMLTTGGTQKTFTYKNTTGATISVQFEGSTYTLANNATRSFTGGVVDKSTDFSADDLNALHQMYPRRLGTAEPGDRFGATSVVGDFNGDGYRDLAVSAPHEGAFSHAKAGAVFIYRGTYTGLVPWTMVEENEFGTGAEADDRFGAGLAVADLTGPSGTPDGYDDLIVGAPNKRGVGGNRAGAVYVFRGGRAEMHLHDFFSAGSLGFTNGPDDDFGFALDVASIGGTRVLVGAPGAMSLSGRVYMLEWSATAPRYNVSGTGTLTVRGRMGDSQVAGNQFGIAITSGQLDGDNNDDIVVGATGAPGGGKLFVFKGGAPVNQIGSISKPGPASLLGAPGFGRALKVARFRTATGKQQLVASAPFEDGGAVYVLDVTLGTSSVTVNHSQKLGGSSLFTDNEYGYDLAVGDLDGDALADLAIGAPLESSPFFGLGRVHVHRGTGATSVSLNAVGAVWTSYTEPATHGSPGSDEYGRFVAIGNFDKLGSARDLAIGAPMKTRSSQSEAGGIWILRGRDNATPELSPTDDQVFTTFLDEEARPQK